MTSKRQIKKQITGTCGSLAAECILAIEFVAGIDKQAMQNILLKIATLQDHAISRCSIAFDKVPADFETGHEYTVARKKYYSDAFRNLIKEFNEKVGEIVKEMNAQLPAEQREANKAAANA
ncbi:MAG: hypothetical protein HDR92_07275 [Bacteroides sp.]|nr:hypothetical protein [Bacteroides sp.]